MSALAAIGAVTGLSAGVIAANSAGGGPDLIGVAAVITAISGLIGTLVMATIAVVRVLRGDDTAAITKAVQDGLKGADHDET